MANDYSELMREIITLAVELDIHDKEAAGKFNMLMAAMMILTMAGGRK